jgi:hypothetical protein
MIQQEFNQIIQAQQFYKMSSTSFRGIYLGEDDKLSIREIDQVYQPTGSQSLVQVKYSAINPADKKHYQMGMHSFIAGYEWIGTVKAIGPDSPYKVGEALFGLAMFGHKRPLSRGAHQDYLLAETWGTARVPKSMLGEGLGEEERDALWRQAVAWPVGARTAIDMLFNELDFAFPGVPGLEQGADPRGRAILIVSDTPWDLMTSYAHTCAVGWCLSCRPVGHPACQSRRLLTHLRHRFRKEPQGGPGCRSNPRI